MTSKLYLIFKLFLIGFLIILMVRFFNLTYSTKPISIGLIDNRFTECPETPNCMSTMTSQLDKQIDPIHFDEDFEYVKDRLTIVFHNIENAELVSTDSTYFHYRFRTFPLAFTDDVEIYIDQQHQRIHLKSASRLGRYDFGTNRKRLEKIIDLYHQTQ